MTEPKNVSIIAFVGLSGTGKSAAATYLAERGMPKVRFAAVIESALAEAGLDDTPDNERMIREQLRLDPVGDVLVNRIISEINDLIAAGQHKIVIDGLGGWEAYKRLKHEFPGSMTVVALTARRHIRHRRLADRAEKPLTEREVDQRDYDAIETLGKGGVIAIADYFIEDNGSLEQLHMNIDDLLRELNL